MKRSKVVGVGLVAIRFPRVALDTRSNQLNTDLPDIHLPKANTRSAILISGPDLAFEHRDDVGCLLQEALQMGIVAHDLSQDKTCSRDDFSKNSAPKEDENPSQAGVRLSARHVRAGGAREGQRILSNLFDIVDLSINVSVFDRVAGICYSSRFAVTAAATSRFPSFCLSFLTRGPLE